MSKNADSRRLPQIQRPETVPMPIETGRTSGQFQKLVLMAPPAFLGMLREQLGGEVRKLVVEEIAKDLVTHSIGEVRDKLRHVL